MSRLDLMQDRFRLVARRHGPIKRRFKGLGFVLVVFSSAWLDKDGEFVFATGREVA